MKTILIINVIVLIYGHKFSYDDLTSHLKAVYPELYSRQYQGDILPFGDVGHSKNALRNDTYRWPNATIPYEITGNFSDDERNKIKTAMQRLESETCLRFEQHSSQKNYVSIGNRKHGGCFAVIGYHEAADQPHPVNLEAPYCLRQQGTIEHELLHITGLFHEQSRPDRDDHVDIYWGNITEDYYMNFQKVSDKEVTTYDVPYDTNSVMHYPKYAFSKNGNDTIVSKKNPDMELGQRKGATRGDLDKVRRMYNCKKKMTDVGSPQWFIDQVQIVKQSNSESITNLIRKNGN